MIRRIGAAIAAGAGATALYGALIEREWLDVQRYDLKLANLSPELAGYRVIQISDTHISHTTRQGYLKRLQRAINALKPDTVVMTGDLMTHNAPHHLRMLEDLLGGIQAKDHVLAVPGNHDYRAAGARTAHHPLRSSIESWRRAIEKTHVTDLSNHFVTVARGNGRLHFAGVDDIWAQHSRLDRILPDLPDDGPVILLVHEPDFADVAGATERFTLQLSGHTHGGQICLPDQRPLARVVHGFRYQRGFYRVRGMMLYVNRGIGTVGIPMRLFCRPEISVFHLYPAPPVTTSWVSNPTR